MHKLIAIASTSVVALLMGGCDSSDNPSLTSSATTPNSQTDVEGTVDTATLGSEQRPALPIAWCDELPDLADSLDFAGMQFSEFPNGYVSGQALAHALQFPYYVAVWPRTNHESWLIVGVSGGMQELQFELDTMFPGARVLAMNITWDQFSLAALSDSVAAAVVPLISDALVDWSIAAGYVMIDVRTESVTPELATAVEPFAESNVCAQLRS